MASWKELENEVPEFTARLRHFLDLRKHKVMGTIRADGSPRLSGTECEIAEGELWIGVMAQALRTRDLARDRRFSLHSGSEDPPAWKGDAKLSGVLLEVDDPETRQRRLGKHAEEGAHLYRADIQEASVVEMGQPPDHLMVLIWSEGKGLRQVRRD